MDDPNGLTWEEAAAWAAEMTLQYEESQRKARAAEAPADEPQTKKQKTESAEAPSEQKMDSAEATSQQKMESAEAPSEQKKESAEAPSEQKMESAEAPSEETPVKKEETTAGDKAAEKSSIEQEKADAGEHENWKAPTPEGCWHYEDDEWKWWDAEGNVWVWREPVTWIAKKIAMSRQKLS